MEKNNKFKSLFTLLAYVCIAVAVFWGKTASSPSVKENKTASSVRRDEAKEKIRTEEASTDNSQTESYTLKYNPEENMVVLITNKSDGSKHIAHIKTINPMYLEPGDAKALMEGIELSSKEDMFILIEDYSS